MPWIEKYRPRTKETLVHKESTLVSINRLSSNFQNVIFSGPSGSGKTSAILLIAKEIYSNSLDEMTIIINASIDNSVSVIKRLVGSFTTFASLSGSSEKKLVIIDEAEGLTKDSQVALTHIMEATRVHFCLICNSISGLLTSIVSRCAIVYFPPLTNAHADEVMMRVVKMENVMISKQARDSILSLSKGDMRVVINTLQTLKAIKGENEIKVKDVCACFGHPLEKAIKSLHKKLMSGSCNESHIEEVMNECHNSLHDIVIGLSKSIVQKIMEGDPNKHIQALINIRDIDLALALSCSQEIQIYSLMMIYE